MAIKICHLTSAHPSKDIRIFYKECTFLAKEDNFDVCLIAPGESRRENNVTVVGIGEKPDSRVKRMFSFTKHVYKAAKELDADIYHFHDPELLPIGKKLKKHGKKVVFDSHEYTYEQIKIKTYIPALVRNFIAEAFHKYETSVCRKIDGVVFPCKVHGKHPFENRSKRAIFVDNYPILSEFENNAENGEKLYDVCHVGSIDEARGITQLLNAVKLSGCKLVLGGHFYSDVYYEQLEKAGLLENVDYRGFCSRNEVVDIYSKSKVGLSTILPLGQYTLGENLPTKVYEFMAMGIPVVLSNFKSSLDTLKEYKFGIAVNPEEPREISDAINVLLNDVDLRTEMGKTGRKAIENEYNWEKEVKKIEKLYDEIIKCE